MARSRRGCCLPGSTFASRYGGRTAVEPGDIPMMRTLHPLTGALFLAALLAGCSSVKLDDKKAPVETRTPADASGAAGAGGATPQSQVATVDLNRDAAAAASASRIVYF